MQFLGRVSEGLRTEHPALSAVTSRAAAALSVLELTPSPGAPAWLMDSDYVDRGRQLGEHLAAATTLAESRNFPSAFVVLRTALEHMIIDRLLLLSTRYVQSAGKLTPEDFRTLEARLASGDLGPNVESVTRSNSGAVRVVSRGLFFNDSSGAVEQISFYSGILENYVPIIGPPRIQEQLNAGHFVDVDEAKRSAERHQTYYTEYLRWAALLENLRLNELATEDEVFEFELHYRFLSAFTHPTSWGHKRVRRGSLRLAGPPYDKDAHVLGELVLLYVAHIAATELDGFLAYCSARDRVDVDCAPELRTIVAEARSLGAHLWFPPSRPTRWDINNEANQRSFKAWRDRVDGYEPTRPEDVEGSGVAPVPDQIERLASLHVPSTELITGNTYVPRWLEADL